MENLKPGTTLCMRDWSYHRDEYSWSFDKVKKITPTGKIRLENGELLSSLGRHEIYNDEMKKLYIQDNIQNSVISMIRRLSDDVRRLIPKLSISDIIRIGNLFESLELENIDSWGRAYNKDWYKSDLDKFINFRNDLKEKGVVDKSKLETTKQCLKEILEEKEELEEEHEKLDSVSYGLNQSITNLRNVIEIIDEKLEEE